MAHKHMPPIWRLLLYCSMVPAVIGTVWFFWPDGVEKPPAFSWHVILVSTLACVFLFVAMPYICAALPGVVHIYADGIGFQRCGGSVAFIKAECISSILFETKEARRFFVVKVARPKPYELRALLPTKKPTEADVVRFLYEVNLSHLLRHDSADGEHLG